MTGRHVVYAALALATACSGPRTPLEVGSKEIPVDIVLGARPSPALPPPQANPETIGFPGFVQPPVPRPEPGFFPGLPPGPCPTANPNDAALLVARESARRPPGPATYPYRNDGTFRVGDGAPVRYPPQMRRSVGAVRASAAGFVFDVGAELLGVTTTTTFQVRNAGDTPDRGLYIARVVTRRPTGTDSFAPDTPILVMPFPAPEYGTGLEDELNQLVGERYRSSGTDPLTQTTMVLEARIAGKTRVDACGEWVDAWDIEVTLGRIVGPTKDLGFTGHLGIATQYGALVVEDHITVTGSEDGVAVESRLRSRINEVPRAPSR